MEKSEFIREVERRLRQYGSRSHGNPPDPIGDLIFIILSNQTEEYAFLETYEALQRRFPTWEDILLAPIDEIAEAIKPGGLYNKKAKYIKAALQKIEKDFGTLSLDALDNLNDEAAITYLKSLPGISAKSARCILMYTKHRQVFPVDTHVWRICRRLGLTPLVPKPNEAQQRELEKEIPADLRYSLHVNMVSHGRETCTTYWPKCSNCVLNDICPSKDQPDEVWGTWRNPKGGWANYKTDKKTK